MRTFFISTVILLMEITSILTQLPNCVKFDFNDPLTMRQFQDGSSLTIRSYSQSSITPFSSSSRFFLSTDPRVHASFQILAGLSKIAVTLTSVFKVAFFLRINGHIGFNSIMTSIVHNGEDQCGVTSINDFVINRWNVFERNICSNELRNGTIRLSTVTTMNSNHTMAIQYLHIYDPQLTDENCEPILTTPPTTTILTTLSTTTPPPITTCLKFDFNDPLILSQFEYCRTNFQPLAIKSYNESSIIPFRSSSRYFLSTNNVVNEDLCLMSLSKITINPTSIFKAACYLQVNGSKQLNHITVSYHIDNGAGSGHLINPVSNEWNTYEYPIYDSLFSTGTVRIRAIVNSGNALAIEYLHIYDPQISDENCVKITTTTTSPSITTKAPQICQWKLGQEIAIGNRCDVQHGYFVFQFDGNAVIYDEHNAPIWNTGTAGFGHTFVFETNGNLVMYSSLGAAVWESMSQDLGGNLLFFQEDRNLVIYNAAQTPIAALWNSRTNVS